MAFGHNELWRALAADSFSEISIMLWFMATTNFGSLRPQNEAFPSHPNMEMVTLIGRCMAEWRQSDWAHVGICRSVTISQFIVIFKVLWASPTSKCGGLRPRSSFPETSRMLCPLGTTKCGGLRPQNEVFQMSRIDKWTFTLFAELSLLPIRTRVRTAVTEDQRLLLTPPKWHEISTLPANGSGLVRKGLMAKTF